MGLFDILRGKREIKQPATDRLFAMSTAYESMKMYEAGAIANENFSELAVGFVVSAIVAFIAVKWLLQYIQTHRFTVFAWYRIALGVLLLVAV